MSIWKHPIAGIVACFLPLVADAQWQSHRVPQDHPNIQAAIDSAAPGDRVLVSPGQWCGATITKPIHLVGSPDAVIVGCPAPTFNGPLRAGFLLANAGASGTTIRKFTFDGVGISNTNLTPLAAAVLGRNADRVIVADTRINGTMQGITNTNGNHWAVVHNQIKGLTALTCEGFCGGGGGIVFQNRTGTARGTGNLAAFNKIEGTIPDGLDEFSMTGIFLLAQDHATAANNKLAIPDNPLALGEGEGVLASDQCCGAGGGLMTTTHSAILFNDGRKSQYVVVIEPDASGGNGNSAGSIIFGNRGTHLINGVTSLVHRRARGFTLFP